MNNTKTAKSTFVSDSAKTWRPTRTLAKIDTSGQEINKLQKINQPTGAATAPRTSSPPSPTIAKTLTSIPLGYQFSFNQVNVGVLGVIDSYRVYRNTSNTIVGATLLRIIAHDPTAAGAVVVQDTVGGGKTYYYWVSSVNKSAQESTRTNAQTGAILSGAADPSNGDLTGKGSVPPIFSGAFGWTTSAGAFVLYWDGTNGSDSIVLYRPDGTTTAVPGSNVSVTVAAGSYYVYPYYDDQTGQLSFVTGGSGTSSKGAICFGTPGLTQAQTQSLFAHVQLSNGALGPIVVPSSGTGSGSGGGSAGKCVREDMIVDVARESELLTIPAKQVRVGDWILGPNGRERVVAVEINPAKVFIAVTLDKGEEVVVTPNHKFSLPLGDKRADELTLGDIMVVRYRGLATLRNLRVVEGEHKVLITTEGPTHIFYAGSDGAKVAVHNVNLSC